MACPLPIPNPRVSTFSRHSSAMKNTHYSSSGLAILSRHKLEQEAAADEPDLRRCLGHNSVLVNTMSKSRRNSDRYRKSFRICEEDMEASSMKKEKEQEKGSVIRAQITKTVKAMMVRRRSMPPTSASITPDINTTTSGRKDTKLVQIPVTDTKTNKNTTTTATTTTTDNNNNNNKLNNRTVRFKGDNERMTTPAPASTASPAKNVLSAKSRHAVALVTGRKFWMTSMMVQTSAG